MPLVVSSTIGAGKRRADHHRGVGTEHPAEFGKLLEPLRDSHDRRRVERQRDRGRDEPAPQERRGAGIGRLAFTAVEVPEDQDREQRHRGRQGQRAHEHAGGGGAQSGHDRADEQGGKGEQDAECPGERACYPRPPQRRSKRVERAVDRSLRHRSALPARPLLGLRRSRCDRVDHPFEGRLAHAAEGHLVAGEHDAIELRTVVSLRVVIGALECADGRAVSARGRAVS